MKNDGRNCLYFYPTAYIDEAQRRGLAEHGDVMRRGKSFMIPFRAAYAQTAVFLVVMNWFDGIVLDRLWVGHGRVWRVPGMEGVPYVKSWKTVLVKRSAATVLYLAIAPLPAAAAVLLGKL